MSTMKKQEELDIIAEEAKKGDLDSMLKLADILSEDIFEKENISLAISYYEKAISKGSSIAANNLGAVYRDIGQFEQAFKYYAISQDLSSKEYGKTVMELNVALCHFLGIGTKKNIEKAREMFVHISNSKDSHAAYDINEANYFLGLIYLNKEGVAQDIDLSRKYLLLADEDGDHESAQYLLQIIGRRKDILYNK